MMNYTVTVNPTKRSITVEYEGYKGTARCCPTDNFDLTAGTELALERAKVAKKNAEMAKAATKPKSVRELVLELEKALPKGQMVVVGNAKEMTAEQKKWLASLAGVSAKCGCSCYNCDEDEGDYESGYDDGYADGYADAEADLSGEEAESKEEVIEALMDKVRAMLDDIII